MTAHQRAMESVDPPLAPSWFPKSEALAWRIGYDQGRQDIQHDLALDAVDAQCVSSARCEHVAFGTSAGSKRCADRKEVLT